LFAKCINVFAFEADAHLAEGQLLHEEPTVKKGKSLKLFVLL
jgi:hypothetical protein